MVYTLMAYSESSVFDCELQLIDWDNGNDLRHATCAKVQKEKGVVSKH